MTGNKITFLFKDNEKIDTSNKSVTFIFGDRPCPDNKLINPLQNRFDFNCNCTTITYESNMFKQRCVKTSCIVEAYDPEKTIFSVNCDCDYKRDTNDFNIDCTGESSGGTTIDFGIINGYQGYNVDVYFSIDINDAIASYGQQSDSVVNVANMRFPHDYNYGFSSDSTILKYTNLDNDFNYGQQSDTFVLFNPYNAFLDPAITEFGHQSDSILIYNPYHEFNRVIESTYGHQVNTLMTFKEWENLVPFDITIDVNYGHESTSFILYDTYNELIPNGTSTSFLFGHDANALIRYSDDPYIKDVEFYTGQQSDNTLQYDIGKFTLEFEGYQGFSVDADLEYTLGLAFTGYQGFKSDLLYIAELNRPYTFSAYSYFGYYIDNVYNPNKIDLMRKTCCVFHHDDLRHIEMLDEPNYNRDYTDIDMLMLQFDSVLTTQPRFTATTTYGFSSAIVDNSVYMTFEMFSGYSANVRTMTFDATIELTVGNFIVDQNEIKVELTKPDDVIADDFYFMNGVESKCNLGVVQTFQPTSQYGWEMTFDLWYETPMRPYAYWGWESESLLTTNYAIHHFQ